MKHIKKVFAFALTIVMAFALALPAFADGSIEIDPGSDATGAVSTTYTYYQLLRASIDGDKVSYYLNDGDDDALRSLLDGVTVDGADLFTFTKSADGSRWNATINKKADGTDYADTDGEAIANALNTDAIKAAALDTDTFESGEKKTVPEGYVLVTSTLGTKLVLDTTNDVKINTKNQYITNEKTASKTNMNVGDTVTYTVNVNIPSTAKVGDVITVHDTINQNLAIAANTIAAHLETATGTEVTLEDGTKKENTETFAKQFTVTEAMLGKTVVITYNAELLSTATDDTGFVNNAFANSPAYETVPTTVKVYTFGIDVDKEFQGVTGDDAANYSATFELRTTAEDAKTAIQFKKDAAGYVKADSDDENKSSTLTVNGKDNINVRGLAAGTYYLVELTTSDGYNLLTQPVIVTITDTTEGDTVSHTVSYKVGENGEAQTGTVTVQNNSGSVLPSTGGIGTTIFYIVGGIMVVGAVVVLLAKRRASSTEE